MSRVRQLTSFEVHTSIGPHPDNFTYLSELDHGKGRLGSRALRSRITSPLPDVFHLRVWIRGQPAPPESLVPKAPAVGAASSELVWTKDAALALGRRGRRLLVGARQGSFGMCGAAWVLRFRLHGDEHFFGLGEKWGRLEKSGVRSTFWNTDVWAHFGHDAISRGVADPMYGSIPYVIVERRGTYSGILLDSVARTFVELPKPGLGKPRTRNQEMLLGAYDGPVSAYFLVGPSLPELTRKLQRLVGVTPRPPLWALGHHQCRWGYRGAEDLSELDTRFTEHAFPCDGLWLDIDYMRGYRVFTTHPEHLPDPETTLGELGARGRHVVAILDPGVKREPGYRVYDEGVQGKHFCLTPEKTAFVGLVWPGDTVFPDFSQEKTRRWWARQVAAFAARGFSGFWLDMNEPATGGIDTAAMSFSNGSVPHALYHNRYALDMARASQRGLLMSAPRLRPFLVTRAHCHGISRYAAVWTGDNYSNETHLKLSIPTTLNLGLSGVPFNAPDVPGFGGDADEDLLIRWYKTAFLFPLLRNHSCAGTRRQEPWAFSASALRVVRHFVRLRYKLLPYLYSLFLEHERTGDALLRPLFYDFPSRPGLSLFDVEDQFLVGPALMQAPVLSKGEPGRRVILPEALWYEAHTGTWRKGGRSTEVRETRDGTPLYVREGQLVPMLMGTPHDNQSRLDRIELHVFLRANTVASARLDYEFDDCASFDYRRGKTSRFSISVEAERSTLRVRVHDVALGYGPAQVCLVLYAHFQRVRVLGNFGSLDLVPKKAKFRFAGQPLDVWKTAVFDVS